MSGNGGCAWGGDVGVKGFVFSADDRGHPLGPGDSARGGVRAARSGGGRAAGRRDVGPRRLSERRSQGGKIGRASCRERGQIPGAAGSLKKKSAGGAIGRGARCGAEGCRATVGVRGVETWGLRVLFSALMIEATP